MKTHTIYLAFILLFACTSAIAAQKQSSNNCVRGTAEPIVNKKIFPHTTFQLQADSLTAFETVLLPNTDKLIIHNWGCEYFTLTFRFETTRLQHDVNDIPFWYNTASSMMAGIVKALDSPLDIPTGLKTLNKYIRQHPNTLKTDVEITYPENDNDNPISSFITLDKIEKLTARTYAVTISFQMGPL